MLLNFPFFLCLSLSLSTLLSIQWKLRDHIRSSSLAANLHTHTYTLTHTPDILIFKWARESKQAATHCTALQTKHKALLMHSCTFGCKAWQYYFSLKAQKQTACSWAPLSLSVNYFSSIYSWACKYHWVRKSGFAVWLLSIIKNTHIHTQPNTAAHTQTLTQLFSFWWFACSSMACAELICLIPAMI